MARFRGGRDFAAREQQAAGRQLPGRITGTEPREFGQLPAPGATAVPGQRRRSGPQDDIREAGEQDGAHDPDAVGEGRGLPGTGGVAARNGMPGPADTASNEGVMIRG